MLVFNLNDFYNTRMEEELKRVEQDYYSAASIQQYFVSIQSICDRVPIIKVVAEQLNGLFPLVGRGVDDALVLKKILVAKERLFLLLAMFHLSSEI
jgi:hypothetical protein